MNKSFFTIAFALLAAITLRAGNHAFDAVIESRENPIKVVDSIATWSPKADILKATAGEYFTFQIGVKAYQSLEDVKVVFKPFKAAGVGGFGKAVMTCFNCGGISSSGEPFTKKVDIAQGKLQPLWIGVDLTGVKPGIYKGKVIVSSSRARSSCPSA